MPRWIANLRTFCLSFYFILFRKQDAQKTPLIRLNIELEKAWRNVFKGNAFSCFMYTSNFIYLRNIRVLYIMYVGVSPTMPVMFIISSFLWPGPPNLNRGPGRGHPPGLVDQPLTNRFAGGRLTAWSLCFQCCYPWTAWVVDQWICWLSCWISKLFDIRLYSTNW